MPSPRKFVYEDPKTGELFYYSRKGPYKKNGRPLLFKGKGEKLNMSDHILNRAVESYADEKAGYPPNCNVATWKKTESVFP